jgi:2,3-bisphosphoglycerate-independent phosphoglycerate mutase
MKDKETGAQLSAHTTNLVPFIYIGDKERLTHYVGSLVDVGPTILTALGLPVPSDMTGASFI